MRGSTTGTTAHNYGGNLACWDIVFGTRFLPTDRDPPLDIGIGAMPNFPTRFWPQLLSPLRWRAVVAESGARLPPGEGVAEIGPKLGLHL